MNEIRRVRLDVKNNLVNQNIKKMYFIKIYEQMVI